MNIALFTSNHYRHNYLANILARSLNLKTIIFEEKSSKVEDFSKYSDQDKLIMKDHFEDRSKSEIEFFGTLSSLPESVKTYHFLNGQINSMETLNILENNEIDLILLFGTSIIKPIILDKFDGKVLNLHLGLSPYYKGSGTNFFPIVNEEFECIGATFHLASNEVDGGAVLHQIRLESFEENDTIHSIGNKVIAEAAHSYPMVVESFINNSVTLQEQRSYADSKIYKIADFTPEKLRQAKVILANDGIKNYLYQKARRQLDKPIISLIDG